jgi:glucosamine--fructose-6-phosphate aminotransferase (isomerizing)
VKSLGNFPDSFLAEIAGQPEALRRAAAGLQVQVGTLIRVAEAGRDRTVVLTGMGASYDACYPLASELARCGRIAPMLDAAELLHFRRGMLGADTLVVAVSQSGSSAEVVRLADELSERTVPLVAVTNGLDNPLARRATHVLDTGAGEETGPSSMTFAASLVVLSGVGWALAGEDPSVGIRRVGSHAEGAAVAIERLLADASLGDELVAWSDERDVIVLLGRGPARAAAEMGALTLKEAAGMQAESFETAQFRHGPVELAGPTLAAVIVATEAETVDLDTALARELAEAGGAVLLVTRSGRTVQGTLGVGIGEVDRSLAPAVSLVPIQLLARRLALLRGRDPGTYQRATKVTSRE